MDVASLEMGLGAKRNKETGCMIGKFPKKYVGFSLKFRPGTLHSACIRLSLRFSDDQGGQICSRSFGFDELLYLSQSLIKPRDTLGSSSENVCASLSTKT